MKKIPILFVSIMLSFSFVNAGIIAVPIVKESVNTNVKSTEVLQKLDVQTFLSLTPSKVKELTGKKMNFKEKIVLKLTQKQIKKELKKGKEVNLAETMRGFTDNFNLGAFLLGVFLSFIGVLIVYLTNWEDPSVARKSAWRGLLTGLVIAAAIIAASGI